MRGRLAPEYRRANVTKQYVVIEDEAHPIDTAEQEASARAELAARGIESADVYAGEPDGLGDSYRTGSKLFAAPSGAC